MKCSNCTFRTSFVAFAFPMHSFSTATRSLRTLDRSIDPVETSRQRQRYSASPSSASSLPTPPANLDAPSSSVFGREDSHLDHATPIKYESKKKGKRQTAAAGSCVRGIASPEARKLVKPRCKSPDAKVVGWNSRKTVNPGSNFHMGILQHDWVGWGDMECHGWDRINTLRGQKIIVSLHQTAIYTSKSASLRLRPLQQLFEPCLLAPGCTVISR